MFVELTLAAFGCFVGNTALTYACAGGFLDVVKVLLKEGANIEDHNENGHTPLMEAASAGHVEVARVLLEYGAGINTHSNEFKESALTLACYKGVCQNNQCTQFIANYTYLPVKNYFNEKVNVYTVERHRV